jgi:hypothetical protein
MNMKRKYFHYTAILFPLLFLISACEQKEYSLSTPGATFKNDVIKRSIGPNLVGLNIEFAYAMALPKEKGKLVSAQVEASIAGASSTYLENKSYYTNSGGVDVGIIVGSPSVNEGTKTTVTFTTDTMAATLRYFYTIPEAARGKSLSFTFSAKSSDGETVSYKMGPYEISNMDMALNLAVKDAGASYISIEDMAVYNAVDAASKADKIDLVYLYRALPTVTFTHALVSPAADPIYLPGITLPTGVNKSTKIRKEFNLPEKSLAASDNTVRGIYIDDVDFQKLDLSDAPNYAINLKAEAGAWVETADGTYRAYIFVNKIDNTGKGMTLSMKRLKMK